MRFLELAKTRYATKRYDSTKRIDDNLVNSLMEILLLSPSSINCQPWKFVFVRNPAIKGELAEVSMHNEHKIKDADLLIVFHVTKSAAAFDRYVDSEMDEQMAKMFKEVRPSLSDEQVDIWLTNQVYIALGFCLSACISLGLDSTPMEGIEQDRYAEIHPVEGYRPIFAVAVGYHDENDRYHPTKTPKNRRPLNDVIDIIN